MKTAEELIKNWIFWAIIIISIVLCFFVSKDKWAEEGFKLFPSVIGVMWAGLVSAIAIIFSLLKEEDIVKLTEEGITVLDELTGLRKHVMCLLVVLVYATLTFVIEIPFVTQFCTSLRITPFDIFYFSQIFSLLLACYLAYEVISSLFLVFEIKHRLYVMPKKHRGRP